MIKGFWRSPEAPICKRPSIFLVKSRIPMVVYRLVLQAIAKNLLSLAINRKRNCYTVKNIRVSKSFSGVLDF
ncbi:MAG: hypothetical protein AAFV28_13775, partial [Cyanobacteria bacterium J06635_13]